MEEPLNCSSRPLTMIKLPMQRAEHAPSSSRLNDDKKNARRFDSLVLVMRFQDFIVIDDRGVTKKCVAKATIGQRH